MITANRPQIAKVTTSPAASSTSSLNDHCWLCTWSRKLRYQESMTYQCKLADQQQCSWPPPLVMHVPHSTVWCLQQSYHTGRTVLQWLIIHETINHNNSQKWFLSHMCMKSENLYWHWSWWLLRVVMECYNEKVLNFFWYQVVYKVYLLYTCQLCMTKLVDLIHFFWRFKEHIIKQQHWNF